MYIRHIYIIYTPNLRLAIAVPGREREQGRLRGSNKGAGASKGEHRGSIRAQQEERFWLLREPDLAVLYPAIVAPIILSYGVT